MLKSKVISQAENLYDAFNESTIGENAWEYVYDTFPNYNSGGDDTDLAVDYLLKKFEEFLEQYSENVFSMHADELSEILYAGLT